MRHATLRVAGAGRSTVCSRAGNCTAVSALAAERRTGLSRGLLKFAGAPGRAAGDPAAVPAGSGAGALEATNGEQRPHEYRSAAPGALPQRSAGGGAGGRVEVLGRGMPRDRLEAARWYRLEADQCHANAEEGSTAFDDRDSWPQRTPCGDTGLLATGFRTDHSGRGSRRPGKSARLRA